MGNELKNYVQQWWNNRVLKDMIYYKRGGRNDNRKRNIWTYKR